MRPHCDSMDGPVVRAAIAALDAGDPSIVLPYVPAEGEPFTGLKPAGLGHGPVLPLAERAIESGSAAGLGELLCDVVREEVARRLDQVMERKREADGGVEANRRFVSAALGLQVWAHELHERARSAPHGQHRQEHAP